MGLTRGSLASLWKIGDRATADLMRPFYQAMRGQDMRPSATLRAAQMQMLKDKRWSLSYFWAAFQIQGEWK